ncbi:MAG: AraC family transcriptional regulator [Aerococcus sp.]|nr:AraC family transcriptional regulator [Aerococcus sp.]
MYTGQCTQGINDEPITLTAGNLIMLDKDIQQRIDYVGESDILVNILVEDVKDDSLVNPLYTAILNPDSLVTQFLLNANNDEIVHNNFILFKLDDHPLATHLIECLLLKDFSTDENKTESLHMLLALLLPELTRAIEREVYTSYDEQSSDILAVLIYIDTYYATVTLSSLGEQFGYNPHYLGNKLQAETGQTFQELLDHKRSSVAKTLIHQTDQSIEVIAQLVGFKSVPSLYRLLQKIEHQTPGSYRKRNGR